MTSTTTLTGRIVQFGGGSFDGHEGDVVRYTGSLVESHGTYSVLGLCACSACLEYDLQCDALGVDADGASLRYALGDSETGRRLDHVRVESFRSVVRSDPAFFAPIPR